MVATAIYSVTMELWKEAAFPLCRAMERRWKRNVSREGVFCDSGDTPANLLCELNGHYMPCTSCFYGKWVEDVCTGQFGVFVYLILHCLVGCCICFSSRYCVFSEIEIHISYIDFTLLSTEIA